jgi:flavin reductase (DIM6/NTAB) family NADH-FMN oxidoreductase RutF
MVRNKVEPFEHIDETNMLMIEGGLLLVSQGKDEKPNIMTIGWGFLGTIWRKPYFVVAVRKSRHTYKLMEESNSFTVCVPTKGMDNVLEVCGEKSGRDMDKFDSLKLTIEKGLTIDAPFIGECPIHYECEIKYKNVLMPETLDEEIVKEVYPTRDMHVLYYGEVKGAYTSI